SFVLRRCSRRSSANSQDRPRLRPGNSFGSVPVPATKPRSDSRFRRDCRMFFSLRRSPVSKLSAPACRLPSPREGRFLPHLEALEQRCLLSVDPILEWNAVAIQIDQSSYSGLDVNDQAGPTRSSRALAIEHAAMFDAWNSINNRYTPYLTMAPNADNASD